MTSTQNRVAAGTVDGSATPSAAHKQLEALIGRWITTGHVRAPNGQADAAIAASDIYEWAPGGFFVVHTAYGTIGTQPVGGIEIIGYDPEAKHFITSFFDSQGNVTGEALSVDDRTWTWVGAEVRCTGALDERGERLVCRH